MSRSVHKNRTEAQANRNHKGIQTNVSQAIVQINTTLDQLRDRIIPSQPYLLSVPSDVPYRYYGTQFIESWYIGTPFSVEEEQLQYLSFLSHQGDEESLLKVVGGWADETGNLIEEEALSPLPLSGQNTPIEPASRKKISLKDYKIKDKTRPSTPTTKVSPQELRKQVMKSEAQEHIVKAEDGQKSAKPSDRPQSRNELRGNPRIVKSGIDGTQSPQVAAESRRQDVLAPRKRRKLSIDGFKNEDPPVKSEKPREPEDTKGLPSLLSPTLPARQKDRAHKALPGLLSPDLPPALEKLLARADTRPRPDGHPVPRTDSVKAILGNALGPIAGKRPPEKVLGEPSANRGRSDSQTSTKTAANTPRAQSPVTKPPLKTLTRPVTPLQQGVSASPKPRQRHVVALRYGKKNRKRVEALLKLAPPRPKKVRPNIEELNSRPQETRTALTKSVPDPDNNERKRPAEPSPERHVKKIKQTDTPEKLKVPTTTAGKSPAKTTVPKATQNLLTPKKEPKSSAMRRIESQDGGDAQTPRVDRARTSTPNNAAHSSQTQASPGASSAVSKEDRAAWLDLDQKFFALGRTLKHEGTSLGPGTGGERSDKDSALSVVLLIEALLCFMINHAAKSQARPNVDPGWSTILPYHIFVFRASRKYRQLHGLVIQLGAICRQAIHNHDIERLAREPLPFEHFESAPTPGSDGNTKQIDDAEKAKKRYIAFRDQLVLNARELQSAWLEGSRYLSATLIEREYPRTWARRMKDTGERGHEKLKPDSISKGYHLPLDISSNAFEATRFSLSFLKEWSEKEKIDWKPRMDL